jgi:hypothetical protein
MEGRDELEAALLGQLRRKLLRVIEIAAVLDQFGTEGPHRGILLDRVAARHHDRGMHPEVTRRERETLAVVPPGRAEDAADVRTLSCKAVEIDETASHLEGADRRVVLVLHDDRAPEPPGEKRPRVLGRGGHGRVHDGCGVFEVVESEHHA